MILGRYRSVDDDAWSDVSRTVQDDRIAQPMNTQASNGSVPVVTRRSSNSRTDPLPTPSSPPTRMSIETPTLATMGHFTYEPSQDMREQKI